MPLYQVRAGAASGEWCRIDLDFASWIAKRLPKTSGDLDGGLQPSGDLLGERHDEVPVERGGDAGKGVEAVLRTAAPSARRP
jgi:hypothetical protein